MKNFYTLFEPRTVPSIGSVGGIVRHTSFVYVCVERRKLGVELIVCDFVRRWNETSKVGVRAAVIAPPAAAHIQKLVSFECRANNGA